MDHKKIIKEAKSIISSIDLAMQRQAGMKIGNINTHSIEIPKDKQNKLDKLNNLVHYACYLEQQNNEYFTEFADLNERIKTLNYQLNYLQNKININEKIKEL